MTQRIMLALCDPPGGSNAASSPGRAARYSVHWREARERLRLIPNEYTTLFAEYGQRFREQGTYSTELTPAQIECRIGLLFYYGLDGLPQDTKRAKKWFGFAARRGSAAAETLLGSIYAREGPHNEGKTAQHYLKATRKNDYRRAVKLSSELKELGGCLATPENNTVEKTPKHEHNIGINIPLRIPRSGFVNPKIILEITNKYLAEVEVPEQDRPALAEEFAQRVQKLRRLRAAQEAAQASWQQRATAQAGAAAVTGQPDGQPPKKRGRPLKYPPPTDEEIRDAERLRQWHARNKDKPIDPVLLRKARRDATWAYRERKSQKAGPSRD